MSPLDSLCRMCLLVGAEKSAPPFLLTFLYSELQWKNKAKFLLTKQLLVSVSS